MKFSSISDIFRYSEIFINVGNTSDEEINNHNNNDNQNDDDLPPSRNW